jgi:hypothetical protein
MAWSSVDVKIKGKSWGAMMKPSDSAVVFSVSCACKIKVGDAIECGDDTYKAASVTDVAYRGETFLVETEGKSDDKSETRGTEDSSS